MRQLPLQHSKCALDLEKWHGCDVLLASWPSLHQPWIIDRGGVFASYTPVVIWISKPRAGISRKA